MYSVIETEPFAQWLASIKDSSTRVRLARRIDKARRGLLGDIVSIGEGVSEMREFFGPGWRMYYVMQGTTLIMMLGGGDKSTQVQDIERAKALALELRNEKDQNSPI